MEKNASKNRCQKIGVSVQVINLFFFLSFMAMSESSAYAQSATEKGNCGLISVDSKGHIAFPLMVVPGEARLSSNPGGKTRVQCSGIMPERPMEQVTLDYASTEEIIGAGIFCHTPWGEATQDWEQVVSPNGQATLTCHLNGSSNP